MKAIVVAIDKKNGIGAENDLLWFRDLPTDRKHFQKLTTGCTVIMGRKTFESMNRKPLPNRENIVVSRTPTGVKGVLSAHSLQSAYALTRFPTFVIGGERIYREALDDMDVLHVTEVDAEFPQATVFFPEIDLKKWRETSREHHNADEKNKYAFDFVTYGRKLG